MPQGSEIAASIEFLLKPDQPLTGEDLSALRGHIADLDAVVAGRESA
jgi:hypothetical protein